MARGPVSGSSVSVSVSVGDAKSCTITNSINDADGDHIPDFLDCSSLAENRVVDPAGLLTPYPAVPRYTTLQAAVNAAADNDVITMYGNTTENVIIGTSPTSNNKDLHIIGCGHKVTAAAAGSTGHQDPATAGKSDGAGGNGTGEKDIQIDDVHTVNGTIGYLVQTGATRPRCSRTSR